ncbi:MAG TPA: hypothetical protein VGF14_05815 [Alphaproteobacteria bacterium]
MRKNASVTGVSGLFGVGIKNAYNRYMRVNRRRRIDIMLSGMKAVTNIVINVFWLSMIRLYHKE